MTRPNWMSAFITPGKTTEGDQEIEIKPEDVKKQLGIDVLETRTAKIDTIETSVNEVTAYIRQQKADRIAAQQAEEARQTRIREQKENENAPTFEDDPEGALSRRLDPIVKQNNLLTAKQTVRDLVEAGSFEFYTGEIKLEVDKLVEAGAKVGPLSTEYIENCYHIAKGKRDKEIQEGKIKSRFSAASSSSTGTGGLPVDGKIEKALTEEEKHYARVFGLDDKTYNEYREAEYV